MNGPVFEWSTIILVSVDPNHLKTGQKCPVFKWFESTDIKMMVNHSKTGHFVRFSNGMDHLNTGH